MRKKRDILSAGISFVLVTKSHTIINPNKTHFYKSTSFPFNFFITKKCCKTTKEYWRFFRSFTFFSGVNWYISLGTGKKIFLIFKQELSHWRKDCTPVGKKVYLFWNIILYRRHLHANNSDASGKIQLHILYRSCFKSIRQLTLNKLVSLVGSSLHQ